jgi:hypothetical protein
MDNAFLLWFDLHFDADDFRFQSDYQECKDLTADAWDAALEAIYEILKKKDYLANYGTSLDAIYYESDIAEAKQDLVAELMVTVEELKYRG